ncbi:B3 domain-containing protein LFL1-like isoform X3 [Onychomys torridus]|uniref:B3 domain-containing protein LFL1-like isoform X3 n=1 Tax=Onychomys torridus TaxID=38674 RepID=UPI00167FB6F9|nr:B3 domain-containing protein LFL1-like isoform X3 [Onychomys torridus]
MEISTNTRKVRRKVRTPARPASLPRLRPQRPGAARTGLAAGLPPPPPPPLLLGLPLPPAAASDRTAQSARAPVSRARFSKSSSPARRRDALLLHLSPTSRGRPGELSRELAAPPR